MTQSLLSKPELLEHITAIIVFGSSALGIFVKISPVTKKTDSDGTLIINIVPQSLANDGRIR